MNLVFTLSFFFHKSQRRGCTFSFRVFFAHSRSWRYLTRFVVPHWLLWMFFYLYYYSGDKIRRSTRQKERERAKRLVELVYGSSFLFCFFFFKFYLLIKRDKTMCKRLQFIKKLLGAQNTRLYKNYDASKQWIIKSSQKTDRFNQMRK